MDAMGNRDLPWRFRQRLASTEPFFQANRLMQPGGEREKPGIMGRGNKWPID
jgi:hypothetical protein